MAKGFPPGDVEMMRQWYVMTQKEFADFVGVSVSAVKRWERIESFPSRGNSLKLQRIKERIIEYCQKHHNQSPWELVERLGYYPSGVNIHQKAYFRQKTE